MVQWYHPDIILIACNTLSVVYPETEYSKISTAPVLGIVGLGADLIGQKMKTDTSSSVIIFGTETTIAANSHKTLLEAKGISAARIIPEACADLAGEIQSNPASDIVENMINMYVSDAVSQIPGSGEKKIYAGFCCTHYGFCSSTFLKAFNAAGVKNVEIINPNDEMARIIFTGTVKNKFPSTLVTVTVVSRAPLSKEETSSISSLLEHNSPKTAAALRMYEYKQDLFRYVKE